MVYERDRPSSYKGDRGTIRHSPPLISRVLTNRRDDRYEDRYDNRYEERNRREESGSLSKGFSTFYRKRFGSHSPEDYRNLRLSQFDSKHSKNDIRLLLEREFKKFAPFEIKIVRNPDDDERLAYVNFDRDNCAKTIRRTMISHLQKVFGRRLALDPTGVLRDQDGKYIPDRFNRIVMAAERDYRRERSPRSYRRRSSSRDYSRSQSRSRSYSRSRSKSRTRSRSPTPNRNGNSNVCISRIPSNKYRESARENPFVNLNQDDTQATRTLCIGNLPGDTHESQLRRIFEIFGRIDEIDLKILSSTAAFAFIVFRTVESAIEARHCQHNKPIRPGSTRCQIGYSKTKPSNRLYIGNLGPWATKDMLESEFDRYGAIDEIEYQHEDNYACIRFVDLDSASDACARMKNFELANGKFITVDFAKDYGKSQNNRKRGRSSSEELTDLKRATTEDGRSWSPTSAGYIETVNDLRDNFACTWKGYVTLKKVDYPLSFHRIFGKEHLLQDFLRDEDGNALKLHISQRVKVDQAFYQEHIELEPKEMALMVAVSNNTSSERIVQYLKEKNAAGLVTLDNCTIYFLPYSVIADRLLKFFAPRIAVIKPQSNHILVILRKLRKTKLSQSAQNRSLQNKDFNYDLHPPPPLPSLGGKEEVDNDKLEELHQKSIQNQQSMKSKEKIITQSSLLNPAPPLPPDLNQTSKNTNFDNSTAKKLSINDKNNKTAINESSKSQRSLSSSSNSSSDEETEKENDSYSNSVAEDDDDMTYEKTQKNY